MSEHAATHEQGATAPMTASGWTSAALGVVLAAFMLGGLVVSAAAEIGDVEAAGRYAGPTT